MFGTLGMPELILIFVVALLLFGPRKMPQIGRSIGRAMGEFRRASNEFKRTIEDEVAGIDGIDDITSVRRTRNPLSSPALSMDRLSIRYGKGRRIMISPADQAGFLEAIGHELSD